MRSRNKIIFVNHGVKKKTATYTYTKYVVTYLDWYHVRLQTVLRTNDIYSYSGIIVTFLLVLDNFFFSMAVDKMLVSVPWRDRVLKNVKFWDYFFF